jgi:hypothetical protein
MAGGYYQFQAPQLRVIPMRRPNETQERHVRKHVQEIVALMNATPPPHDEIQMVRNKIDQIIFDVFDLDDTERETLDPKT